MNQSDERDFPARDLQWRTKWRAPTTSRIAGIDEGLDAMNLWQDEKPPGRPAWATGGSRSINSTGAEHSSGKARRSRTISRPMPPGSWTKSTFGLPFSESRTTRFAFARQGYVFKRVSTTTRCARMPGPTTERQASQRNILWSQCECCRVAHCRQFSEFSDHKIRKRRARNPNAGFTENRLTRIRRSRWTPGRRPCSRQVAKGIPICHSRSRRLYAGWLRSGWLQHIIAAKESPTRSLGRKKTTAEEGGLSSGP